MYACDKYRWNFPALITCIPRYSVHLTSIITKLAIKGPLFSERNCHRLLYKKTGWFRYTDTDLDLDIYWNDDCVHVYM